MWNVYLSNGNVIKVEAVEMQESSSFFSLGSPGTTLRAFQWDLSSVL